MDYDSLCTTYKDGIECPKDFNFATHILDVWAEKIPRNLAIHWVSSDFRNELKYTYAALADASNRAAQAFAAMGIKKGDRIMIVLPKVCDWWICCFGLMRIGAIPIPGTSLLVGKDLEFRS